MTPGKLALAAVRFLVCGLCVGVIAAAHGQQSFPTKPIRFITPFAPGGQTTILARLIGQKLTEAWGQPVIVDNRPGGNTIIGTETLARAAPDGYTLILTTNSHVIIPHLHAKLPFDPIKDFAAVSTLSSNETLLLVHPSFGVSSLQELIAVAKQKPGQLNYASLGTGGIQHLSSEMFNLVAGIDVRGIPYKGGGPAIIALIGGQVHMSIQGPATSLPHIKSGKVRALAITGSARWPVLPDLPTFAESGLPAYDMKYWQAILAPAATPRDLVQRIASEVTRIQNMPDTRERLISLGLDPWIATPAQFSGILLTEMAKYGKIIKAASIKLDQ